MKKILVLICMIFNVVLSSFAYGLIGHDAPEIQPLYGKHMPGDAVEAFKKINKDRCPNTVKKIQALGHKGSLWYSEGTTHGRRGIRRATVDDCDAEAQKRGA